MSAFVPHWRPSGWFQVGWSEDIGALAVRPLHYFDTELVAFRDQGGALHVLDAYCRHLGGNLGYGGHVEGDCVVCPFHGWHWDAQGENQYIPYQPDRPNRARRIRSWPCREVDGVVYLWHDLNGGPPTWEPPDIFTDTSEHTAALDYHAAGPQGLIRYGALRLHPQLVQENAADPIHFRYVHGTKHHPVFIRRWEDETSWFSQLGFGSKWRELDPTSHDGDTLSILCAGVGMSYTSLSGSDNTLVLLSTTPVGGDVSEMFQTVWLEKLPGDDEPGAVAARIARATAQLPRDIEIWTHQRYEDPPALATSEGRAFSDMRRWAKRFYPDDPTAPRLHSAASSPASPPRLPR
jgi:3-ketosteroid 9alpha-monooxygenase subunit A